jgi:FtsZ-binding cell division protein ZapB
MLEELDLSRIQDERARQCIILLLNLVEDLKQENHTLREELQRLRDEINRLKGEQGKPSIRPATIAPTDHASERERHTPNAWAKARKLGEITIDREQGVTVDRALLPPDAECKG